MKNEHPDKVMCIFLGQIEDNEEVIKQDMETVVHSGTHHAGDYCCSWDLSLVYDKRFQPSLLAKGFDLYFLTLGALCLRGCEIVSVLTVSVVGRLHLLGDFGMSRKDMRWCWSLNHDRIKVMKVVCKLHGILAALWSVDYSGLYLPFKYDSDHCRDN